MEFVRAALLLSILTLALAQDPGEWKIFNQQSPQCGSQCSYTRIRYCGPGLCQSGVVIEDVRQCPKTVGDLCVGGTMERPSVITPCPVQCDTRKSTKVNRYCSVAPDCQVTQTSYCVCNGNWGAWGEYGACNTTCYRRRERGCYGGEQPDHPSINCAGSKGLHLQYESAKCPGCIMESSTTTTKATTTTKEPLKKNVAQRKPDNNVPMSCLAQCSEARRAMDQGRLIDGCQPMMRPDVCNSTADLVVNCNHSEENNAASCILPEKPPSCLAFLDWKEWCAWQTEQDEATKQVRFREQWCAIHVPSTDCRNVVKMEKQCRTLGLPEPSSSPDWQTWLIALLFVVVLLVTIITFCVHRHRRSGRRRRRKKKKNRAASESMSHAVELKSIAEESVFEPDAFADNRGSSQEKEDEAKRRRMKSKEAAMSGSSSGGQNPNHLSVASRIARASDHLYESISARGARLFSRSSAGSTTDAQERAEVGGGSGKGGGAKACPQTEGNEYVVDEEEARSQEKACKAGRIYHANPLRISVMVTDPEGVQVDNSVFGPTLTEAMRNDPPESKRRWSRVPSPRDNRKATAFFQKPTDDRNPHVPSVKYITGDETNDANAPSVPLPAKKTKLDLKSIFKKLGGSPKSEKDHQNHPRAHQYDTVAKEDMSLLRETSGRRSRIFVSSATGSTLGLEDDNTSMWSESSFDGMYSDEDSTPPPDSLTAPRAAESSVHYKSPRRSKVHRHTKRHTTGETNKHQKADISHKEAEASKSLPLPPPPTLLFPHIDVQGPGALAEPRREPNPDPPKAGQLLRVGETPSVGYMSMTGKAAEQGRRKEVHSWVNLGKAPNIPSGKNKVSRKNVTLKLSPPAPVEPPYCTPIAPGHGWRVKGLDEKYVATIEVPNRVKRGHLAPGELPTDKHGYFDLGVPK